MIKKLLILPQDVLVIPVAKLSEDIQRQLQCSQGDYAVTRPTSRIRSKIIDENAARFLEEFRTPTTIIEAVIRYSKIIALEPDKLLEISFPLLESLVNSYWLVDATSSDINLPQPNLVPGTEISGWKVVRCIQSLEDTEIYQVQDESGKLAALKLFRQYPTSLGKKFFEQESFILEHLDGQVNPTLLSTGIFNNLNYLLLEWIPGVNISSLAEKYRLSYSKEARTNLIKLFASIVRAYEHLHKQGILHGDIHQNNILINDDDVVKIVDYGLSRQVNSQNSINDPPRGGIAFFFEPEYALCRLNNQSLPPVTQKSEQYSLAALFYYLSTGSHYLDFSLDKESQLKQILECEPLPFTRRGISSFPKLESILSKALSKNPSNRFASIAEFALSLETLQESISQGESLPLTEQLPNFVEFEQLCNLTLEKLTLSGALLRNQHFPAPKSSVTYGAAGIAYVLYRLACLNNNSSLLSLADVWSNTALKNASYIDAFYSNELGITPKIVGKISLYHSLSGVHCVQSLISHAMNDLVSRNEALENFIACSSEPDSPLDISFGRSGILIGCALLYDAIPKATSILEHGDTVLKSICNQIEMFKPIAESNEVRYTGIAHGWAGILYSILRWCHVRKTPLPNGIEERLHQLSACAELDETNSALKWSRLVPSVSNVKGKDYMPGWCNGTAGFVFLWTLAHQLLGDKFYFELAEKAALNVIEDPDRIANLCCGFAGRAYALLNLYKYSGDSKWLADANRLAILALNDSQRFGFATHSLYKGDLGLVLLGEDLKHPEFSSMPLFENEGWSH